MENKINIKKWPNGYCLDPHGVMCAPKGKADDFNFGYEIGFADAWKIMNEVIKSADLARFEAGQIVKKINKRNKIEGNHGN